jgi:hypothetical protein
LVINSQHQTTTFEDRQQFVQQHQQGASYAALAQASGWKAETIRKHCQAFQREGATALQPRALGLHRRVC